jgi:hypothetical protein
MVAARVANMPQYGDGSNQHQKRVASIDATQPPVSQTRAAEMLNVSRPSVQRAKKVIDRGAPELVAAVASW